ncbi:MAG: protoporphyrinogen/coproporphyrinogen oxidase [Planctomycetia bacterium]
MKIAILGAGVSGLSLARFLVEGGVPADDLTLYESAPVAGGLCRSKTVDGYTYDVSGGHILYSKDKPALEWILAQGGGRERFTSVERHTRIRYGQRWVNYPFENGLGDLPPEANFECLRGYVNAWHDRASRGTSAPQEFGAWVRWRFGAGIAEHFMDPYNEKVWKRAMHELTSDWVAGRVPDAPVEDVLRSSVGIRTEGYTHQSVFHYPLQGGFQAITDALHARLAARVKLGHRVECVEKTGSGWSVDGDMHDCVVSTLSLTDMPAIVRAMPSDAARACRELEYNGIVCILVALDRPEHPPLSWIYLPHASQGPANRVTYMSNYSPHLAPAGKSSFLCEVTVRGGAPCPGAQLEHEVVEGLVQSGIARRDEVLFTDRSEIRQAYVVFDHGYAARRQAALSWLEGHGITQLGRFGRFEYDNSDQCVIKSRALAQKLLQRRQTGA